MDSKSIVVPLPEISENSRWQFWNKRYSASPFFLGIPINQ